MQSEIGNRKLEIGNSLALLGLFLLLLAGCQTTARVHLIPLGARTIDPAVPLISTVIIPECVYWTNEAGKLCVAMSLGPLSEPSGGSGGGPSFQLSLELEEPPEGPGRDYPVDRRTLRAIWHRGSEHLRFASIVGVVTLRKSALRAGYSGQFRINCRKQGFNIFFGWAFNAEYLLLGEFEARPDDRRGPRILRATEGTGLERVPAEAVLPTSRMGGAGPSQI